MAKKGNKPWKKSGSASSATATTKKKLRAPTKVYQDVFFTSGTAKDVAQFMDTVEQLLRYMATSDWKQASDLDKVMTDLKDLTMVAPVRPTITYLSGSGTDVVETTNRITLGVVNTPIVNNMN